MLPAYSQLTSGLPFGVANSSREAPEAVVSGSDCVTLARISTQLWQWHDADGMTPMDLARNQVQKFQLSNNEAALVNGSIIVYLV